MSKRTNSNTAEPQVKKRIRSNANRPGFRASRPCEAEVEQAVSGISQIRTLDTYQGRARTKTKKRAHAIPNGDEPSTSSSTTDAGPESSTTSNMPPPEMKPKRDRGTTQTKLLEWLELRDSTLDELLRLDGLGPAVEDSKCSSCLDGQGTHRCLDCGPGTRMLCMSCMVTKHCDLGLHRVEVCIHLMSFSHMLTTKRRNGMENSSKRPASPT